MNKIKITEGHTLFIDGNYISPRASQKVINHSPDGFSFGYGGSGPAQAALAILLEFTDRETALRLYQTFKWEHVSKWKESDMEIDLDVKKWIKDNR